MIACTENNLRTECNTDVSGRYDVIALSQIVEQISLGTKCWKSPNTYLKLPNQPLAQFVAQLSDAIRGYWDHFFLCIPIWK